MEYNNQKYSRISLPLNILNIVFCIRWKRNLKNTFNFISYIKQTKWITFKLHVWTTKLIYNNNTTLINSLTYKQFLKSNFLRSAFYFVTLCMYICNGFVTEI